MNHVYLYVRILDPVTTDLGTSPVYWSNSSFRDPGRGSDHHIPTSGVQGGLRPPLHRKVLNPIRIFLNKK